MLSAGFSQEGIWSLGFRTQGYWDLEPGNDYILGPEIGYSNYNLAAHKLQFRFAYLTSRLEHAFRENVLKDDYYLFSPIWHFRRNDLFDPTIHVDLGYMSYDVENEKIFGDLDNESWIASLNFGLGLNLSGGEWGFNYQIGYNLITPESGHVYPAVFGIGFWKML
jgi:hypothetical protein